MIIIEPWNMSTEQILLKHVSRLEFLVQKKNVLGINMSMAFLVQKVF